MSVVGKNYNLRASGKKVMEKSTRIRCIDTYMIQ